MKERTFHHIPKSSKSLELGDFWSIPLNDARFACGRVIGECPPGWRGGQRIFFAGLLDWVSNVPPTSDTIAGARTLIQGVAHIKTILATGGAILGNRLLELDRIEPGLFVEYADGLTYVFRGMEQLRVASPEEEHTWEALSAFGYMFMREYADVHLGRTA
jgi:hypothetical protein